MNTRHPGPGRPRIDPGSQRPHLLRVRLPHATMEELRRVIPQREMSAFVRNLIEQELSRLRNGPWPELEGER